MKNEKQPIPMIGRSAFLGTVMLMFAVLLNLNSFAQDSRISEPVKKDPFAMYVEKHPNTPLVKAIQANPTDKEFNHMFRLAVITEYPEQFTYEAADLERFKAELSQLMSGVNSIDKMVQSGKSYEEAKAAHNRQMESKRLQNEATTGQKSDGTPSKNNSSEPTLTAPQQ